MIELPLVVDKNAPNAADLLVIRTEEVMSMAKRQQKLEELLKKGFATVYKQCLQDVKEKLESSKTWAVTSQAHPED